MAVALICALVVVAGRGAAGPDGTPKSEPASERRVLRVGADPNNLPFTNRQLEGFENEIAALIGRELNADIEYTWRAQRRGFFREMLKQNAVDLVMGVPADFEMALPTNPYYRSTYVFVTRRDRDIEITSLDDPKLRQLSIGVQLVGDDGINTPPAHALARRGIVDNVVGYTIYGDYSEENPPARIVDAVVDGDVDIAIVWGPLAGFFAGQQRDVLELVPVTPQRDPPALEFAFSIAAGVRNGNVTLRDEINTILAEKRAEIDAILARHGVPKLPAADEGHGDGGGQS